MRNLICWTSGKTIVSGKFLHLYCLRGQLFSRLLAEFIFFSRATRCNAKSPDAYYQLCFLPDTFAPWLNIGQWTNPPAFIRYLLDLYQLYPQKFPNQSPIVYYQCNNCHVDMEFRLADAELFQILAKAYEGPSTKCLVFGGSNTLL